MITRREVFIDTSVFKAVFDVDDQYHAEGVKLWKELRGGGFIFVLSNFILDETYTLLSFKAGRKLAYDFHYFIADYTNEFMVERVSLNDELRAWEYFEKYDWKKLSYTDCTSFAVMKRLGITKAAAFDEHFAKMGFEVV